MLDVRRLRYFVAIADSGSMSAASRKIHIAQPALSQNISELERLVGLGLFEREARGVRLTQHGVVLYEHARKVLLAIDEAEAAMRGLRGKDAGPHAVRLALIPSWATSFTPAIVRELRRRSPELSVSFREARNEEAVRAVETGEVDMAVTLTPGKDAERELIRSEPLYALSSQSGPPEISFKDLARSKLLLPAMSNPLRMEIEKAAKREGVTLQVSLEIDGQDTVKRAVEAGIGVSILSWTSIHQERFTGGIFVARIVDPEIYRPVYLRRSADTPENTWGFFRDILREVAMQGGYKKDP